MTLRGIFTPTALAVTISTTLSQAGFGSETDGSSVTMLNQITVTATRTEKLLKDVASCVTVIDSEQIESQLVQNIDELVRYEPGVSVSKGTRTGLDNFTIRGLSGNRIKIVIDGVNQANAFNPGSTYYLSGGRNFIDTDVLKSVEIVRGARLKPLW